MKKGLIVLAVLVAACFTRGIDAQNSAPYKNYFELVTMNDPSNLLDKITIYPPVFGILQGGDTRLKIKVCNNGDTLLKKSFFYVYYKNKKVGKALLPSLKANGSYEFCVNVHDKIGRRDRQNVSFKIKRKKAFRTYRIAHPY